MRFNSSMHIVSFSSGLSSALTVERVLNRYGSDSVQVVFMDTTIEDQDNYRFMDDCKARWEIPITVLREGRTPYQVAEDEHIIPNQKIAPCTYRLKIEMFVAHLEQMDAPPTIHIGYDYTEAHRCGPTRENYESRGWSVDFPLLWKPYELRDYSEVVRHDWGIEPPRTYAMGFTHANCLQWGCVKMGQGDWLRLLLNFPERYARTEGWERQMRDHPTRKNYAILRDQSGGMVTPMTLTELRERYESERETQPLLFELDYEQSPGCVYCGVGDLAPQG